MASKRSDALLDAMTEEVEGGGEAGGRWRGREAEVVEGLRGFCFFKENLKFDNLLIRYISTILNFKLYFRNKIS